MLLDKLKEEKKALKSRLSELNKEIRIEELKVIEDKYGVSVGCIVKGGDGKDYKITSIDPSHGRPWLKGNPRKKDGTFGVAERNIYKCWEK